MPSSSTLRLTTLAPLHQLHSQLPLRPLLGRSRRGISTMPSLIGQPAPNISLPNSDGSGNYSLPLGEKPIALFFFPKAGTAVCTAQACSFRDAKESNVTFKRYPNLEVVGISSDSTSKQASFVDTNHLSYPILSDPQDSARKAFGVGKDLFGFAPGRRTFFIDAKGIVRGVCEASLSGSAHAKFVEKMLEETEGGTK